MPRTTEITHLGNEGYAVCSAAEKLLAEGKTVSFVGLGGSMEPVIHHKTRMVIEPFSGKIADIRPGMPLFVKQEWQKGKRLFTSYATHMCWLVGPAHVLIGNSHGNLDFWCPTEDILGVYLGPHDGEVEVASRSKTKIA